MAFSPDGSKIAFQGPDNQLRVLDIATGADREITRGSAGGIVWGPQAITFESPSAKRLGIVTPGAGGARFVAPARGSVVTPLGFAQDGSLIGSSLYGRAGKLSGKLFTTGIVAFDPATGAPRVLRELQSTVTVSGNGVQLALRSPLDVSADGSSLLMLETLTEESFTGKRPSSKVESTDSAGVVGDAGAACAARQGWRRRLEPLTRQPRWTRAAGFEPATSRSGGGLDDEDEMQADTQDAQPDVENDASGHTATSAAKHAATAERAAARYLARLREPTS